MGDISEVAPFPIKGRSEFVTVDDKGNVREKQRDLLLLFGSELAYLHMFVPFYYIFCRML